MQVKRVHFLAGWLVVLSDSALSFGPFHAGSGGPVDETRQYDVVSKTPHTKSIDGGW
jgi:hypothetical protein